MVWQIGRGGCSLLAHGMCAMVFIFSLHFSLKYMAFCSRLEE